MAKTLNMKTVMTSILCVGASALSSCGFQPLHAPAGSSGVTFKNILVTADRSKVGFSLTQSMRDRIGNSVNPVYLMELTPRLRRRGLGVSGDDVASRFDIILRVDYALKNAKSGKIVDKGNVTATSTFGAPLDPFGRQAAESDAEDRAADQATDRLLAKVAIYLNSNPDIDDISAKAKPRVIDPTVEQIPDPDAVTQPDTSYNP